MDTGIDKIKSISDSVERINIATDDVELWNETNKSYWEKSYWEKVSKDIFDYQGSIKKFSSMPKISELPKDESELNQINSEYHNLKDFIKSFKIKLDQLNNEIAKKKGILESNIRQIKAISLEIKEECKGILDEQIIKHCHTILDKIAQEQTKIIFLNSSISEILSQAKLVKSKISIHPGILGAWENRLLELDGKFRFKFSPEIVKSWLQEAEKKSNENNLLLQRIEGKNSFLAKDIENYYVQYDKDKLLHSYNNSNNAFISIKNSTDNSSGISIEEALIKLKKNHDLIKSIQFKINELQSSLNSFEKGIKDYLNDLNNLISNLKLISVKGYELSTRLKNNQQGITFLSKIQKNKGKIDDLLFRARKLESNALQISADFDNKKTEWFNKSGRLKTLIDLLESQNIKLSYQLEYKLFIPKVFTGIIVAILIFFICFYINVEKQKKIDDEIAADQNSSSDNISKLLSTICNSNKYMPVRLNAIRLIYNGQSTPTSLEISNIKNAIIHLQDSESSDDIKIAAALRQLADALDSRSKEQIDIN
jgi:large-conductance mechanosensitive channel